MLVLILNLSFFVRHPSKDDNKHPSGMRNKYQNSHFALSKVFHGLGSILTTCLKC